MLDNRRLISQLHGLERRTARGGKDSIDHGPGAHDDVANAVAGALVLASAHVRKLNFHPQTLGPLRSEWIVAGGFGSPGGGLPISMADGTRGVDDFRQTLRICEMKLVNAKKQRDVILNDIRKACAAVDAGDQRARLELSGLNRSNQEVGGLSFRSRRGRGG